MNYSTQIVKRENNLGLIYKLVVKLLIFSAFYIALIYCMDPTDRSWGAQNSQTLKYLPIFIAVITIPFSFILVYRVKYNFSFLCWFIFFIFIFSGSIYSIKLMGLDVAESFLGRSLNSLVFVLGFYSAYIFQRDKYFRLAISLPVILSAIWISVLSAIWFFGYHFVDKPHIYHEEIFLSVTAALPVFFIIKNFIIKWCLIVLFISSGILTWKFTGFIISSLTIGALLYLVYKDLKDCGKNIEKNIYIFILVLLGLITILSAIYLFQDYQDKLPSGNTHVRMDTYGERIDQFLSSPYFGSYFRGSSMLTRGALYIPSHSDILDVLALGGLVALLFFLFPVLMSLLNFYRKSFNRGQWITFYFIVVLVSIFLISSVNPVLDQPKIAFFYWFSLGYVVSSYMINKNIKNKYFYIKNQNEPSI